MKIPKWLVLAILVPTFWGLWGALTEIPEKWISPPFPPTLGYAVWSLTMIPFAAIALAMTGVALMSVKSRKDLAGDWRSAALGLGSATFFACAAIGFRSAVIGVDSPSRALAASLILVVALAIQSATLALYLGLFDRRGARAIIAAWRSSLVAGFMGALASQFWFLAFALTDAARVRTLALIEVPLAQVVSLKLFREPPSLRDGLGMALIVIAAAILVGAGG